MSKMSVNFLLKKLKDTNASDEIDETLQKILKLSSQNIDEVISTAIEDIKVNNYDGSKWSTLAFSIINSFKEYEKGGEILKALVDSDPENPAYLNNLGVNYLQKQELGNALECFVRAFGIDYKFRGFKTASELPAWKNVSLIIELLNKNNK